MNHARPPAASIERSSKRAKSDGKGGIVSMHIPSVSSEHMPDQTKPSAVHHIQAYTPTVAPHTGPSKYAASYRIAEVCIFHRGSPLILTSNVLASSHRALAHILKPGYKYVIFGVWNQHAKRSRCMLTPSRISQKNLG